MFRTEYMNTDMSVQRINNRHFGNKKEELSQDQRNK